VTQEQVEFEFGFKKSSLKVKPSFTGNTKALLPADE
jgi:hypothetical protein